MARKDLILVLEFDDKGTPKIKKVLSATKAELSKFDKTARQASKGVSSLNTQVSKTSKVVGLFGRMMKSTVGQIAAGMGVMVGVQGAVRAIHNAIANTIRMGREFERAWANVTTMLTVSERETEKLKRQLITLSPTLGSITDLAHGMYQVLSASIEPSKAIKFLAEAAKSAKAGVTDTATAVDALTTVINAYGFAAEDVTKVSDIMFQTVKRGKLTYEGMAGALGTVVPIASQVGVSFEEIAAAMATLTRSGVDVNTTTVQLRQILVSVLKPTKEATETAKALGLEFNAQALRAKGLVGFLKDVIEKTGGNAEAMTNLFGNVRALTGILGLAGDKAEDFSKDLKLIEDALGSTQEAFEKQMKSTDFWIETLKNASEKIRTSFYLGFTEGFAGGIDTAEELEEEITRLTDKAERLGKAFSNVLQNLVPFLESLANGKPVVATFGETLANTIMKAVGLKSPQEDINRRVAEGKEKVNDFIKSLKVLEPTIEEARKQLEKGEENWKRWTEQVKRTDERLSSSQSTLQLSIGGWRVFGNVMVQVGKQHWETYRSILATSKSAEEAYERIAKYRESWKKASETHKDLNKNLEKTKVTLKTLLKEAGLPEMTAAVKSAYLTLAEFAGFLNTQLPPSARAAEEGLSYLGNVVELDLLDVMKQAPPVFEEVAYSVEKNSKKIVLDWSTALSGLAGIFRTFMDDMEGNVQQLFSSLATAFDSIANLADRSFKNIANAIQPVLGQIGGAIGQMISGAEKSFAGLGSALGGAIGSLLGPIGKATGSLLGGLIGGLFKKGEKLTEAQKQAQLIEQWVGGITDKFKKWGDVSETTAKIIAEDIVKKGMQGFAAVSKNFAKIIEDVGVTQKNVNDLWQRAGDILDHMKQGALSTEDGLKALGESFTKLVEGARALGQEGSEAMIAFIQRVRASGYEVKEVTDYVLEQLDRVPDALNTLSSSVVPNWQKMLDKMDKITDDKLKDEWKKKLESMKDSAEKQLKGLSIIARDTFYAMIAEGRSFLEAMDKMKDPLETLRKKYEQLGIEAPSYLKPMFDLLEKMELKPAVFQNLDASLQILHSLQNAAYLTQESFDSLTRYAASFAKTILGVSGNLNQALESMKLTQSQIQQLLPVISQFVGVAAMFGIGVPAWMKTFVTKQLGVDWQKFKDVAKTQANAGVATVEKLKALVDKSANLNQKVIPTHFRNLQDVIGRQAGRIVDAIHGLQGGIDDLGSSLRSGEVGGIGRRKAAQTGWEGYVPPGGMTFIAHPGEYVKVWKRDEVEKGMHEPQVNIMIEPIVIPKTDKYVIEFVARKLERGEWPVHPKSVRTQ